MTSNKYLKYADEVIVIPNRDEVKYNLTPEEYLERLNRLEEPSERLKTLLRSIVYFRDEPTHEASQIRTITFVGAVSGLIVGGILRNPDVHQRYQRLHNASVFDSKYRGNRHFYDTLVVQLVGRGAGFAIKTSLLAGAAATIGFGSIAYRNRLYFPDFAIGFTTLGAITRLWLGSKAMLAGAGFGLIAGCIGYGCSVASEILTGQSVTERRLMRHQEWLQSRDAKLKTLQYLKSREEPNYVED